MNQNEKLVVWIPLPPQASWRGEGIAQTIENIIEHISEHREVEFVVWHKHYEAVSSFAHEMNNVTVKAIGIRSHKLTNKESIVSLNSLEQDSVWELFKVKIPFISSIKNKIQNYISQAEYLITTLYYTYLQSVDKFVGKKCNIWIPSPIIPFIGMLKGRIIVSFWDPFVFEYNSDFGLTSKYLFKKTTKYLNCSNVIITQSDSNKDYLTKVFGIEQNKINVVYNGSPDYSKYISDFKGKDIFDIWSRRDFSGISIEQAKEKAIVYQLNYSVLWRLLMKTRSEKRNIVLISTQCRPYKGFHLLLKLLSEMSTREDVYEYIFTCKVPKELKIQYPNIYERIHEITRLENRLHASLYHLSDIILHPSHVEGGLGAYPQFEAASLGKPSLINVGRHVYEMESSGYNISLIASNFSNFDETISRINSLIYNEGDVNANVKEVIKNKTSWDEAAKNYEDIFFEVNENAR
ncbi:glycosyltransferase [Vibrio fluvialis]|uniref:glycosyltransferase n=1 Tax=Vibrio fluvialis TaxID=676 RepID=UPI001EEBD787|nr:glycosyltransferase [Vibrio fluvialis]MCG6349099.1 glycosyltransferase [Vibrio fluvialis]